MNERDLFDAALEKHDPAERAAFLAAGCAESPELRQRLERLLRLHAEAGSFLEQPAAAPAETVDSAPGAAPREPGPAPEEVGAHIGPYKLLQQLGQGGMGVVWVAEQTEPVKRRVALKVVKPGMDSAQVLHRFEAERQALALMDHTNIARVLDAGSTAWGRPYFVMELVKGVPITRYCDELHLTLRERLGLFIPVCQALQHAHQKGIIHRDIKPSNVLVAVQDGVPVPKVIDFGVAKALHQRLTEQTLYTEIGQVVGTLEYMAPEQAELSALDVDTRADVYALGVLLYELLTGTTPLDSKRLRAAAYTEVVRLIKEEEPPRPSTRLTQSKEALADLAVRRRTDPTRLLKAVRGDLDWIVMKCLEKDRTRRYETANALARDLQRYLADETVEACPPSAGYRLRKLARRYRTALISAGLFVAVLLLAALVSTWLAVRATVAERGALAARDAEAEERREAEQQTEVAKHQSTIATERAEALAWEDYINRVNRAYREVQDDNIALAEDLLQGCPRERRGWEWHHVNRLCQPERLSVEAAAAGVSALAFSPDGRLIATGTAGNPPQGEGRSQVELWDRETGQRRPTGPRTRNVIRSLAFSPDGTRLAVGGVDPHVEVWDVKTGELVWAKREPQLPQAMSVAFSPDGESLAAGFGRYSQDKGFEVKLYQATTGLERVTFPAPAGGVNELAFHRDGRRLAVAGAEIVQVWDVAARVKVQDLRGHAKWVYAVAYSPDGKWLATGGWDRTIKLRDAASGEERLTIFGHAGFVLDLAFSPDSRTLASTSEDRSVRLWEVPSGRQTGVFHGHTDFVHAVAFAPDGRELASGGLEGTLKVWDRRTSLPVVFDQHTGWVVRLAFRRDGRRVVSEAGPFRVERETTKGWDPATGVSDPSLNGIVPDKRGDEYCPPSSFPFWVPPEPVTSPDGKLLARVWGGVGGIPPADRSRKLANSSVVVQDAATGRVLHTLIGHTADLVGIAFSPDGRRIATASLDRTVKLWDPATGREVFTLRGHTAGVLELAFSPDGRRIISGSIDFTARVWDGTPLPAEALQAQDVRYRQKTKEVEELAQASEEAQRAERLARTGQWDLAAVAFGKFVEQEPDNLMLRYPHIRSLMEAGNKAGVRLACEELLKRLVKANDSTQFIRVAWCCALTPDAVADHETPLRLVQAVLAEHPENSAKEKSDMLNTLGAALYRAGRFAEAVRRLDEGIQVRGDGGAPQGFAFLALAHHHLGHREEAKRWLDKLVAYQPREGAEFSWDEVEIRILRREAESLALGSGPAAALPSFPVPTRKGRDNP
jgi:WD40 repeat protein/serine/threonine protein kinase